MGKSNLWIRWIRRFPGERASVRWRLCSIIQKFLGSPVSGFNSYFLWGLRFVFYDHVFLLPILRLETSRVFHLPRRRSFSPTFRSYVSSLSFSFSYLSFSALRPSLTIPLLPFFFFLFFLQGFVRCSLHLPMPRALFRFHPGPRHLYTCPLLDDSTIRYLDEGEAGSSCLEGVEDANEIRIRFGRCVVQMFRVILRMLFVLFVFT